MAEATGGDDHGPVALIPAAGRATRMGLLPCSKEILPVGFDHDAAGRPRRPKALIEYLLEGLEAAGCRRAVIVLRRGKEDIARHLARLPGLAGRCETVWTDGTPTVPHTLDLAREHLAGSQVILGFPDILLRPTDACARVRELRERSGADLALGLFPTDEPERCDMVELDPDGRVVGLRIKEAGCRLPLTWSVAAWSPAFTDFIHGYLASTAAARRARDSAELYVGDVIRAAIEQGLDVVAHPFSSGFSLDTGTPAALERAVRALTLGRPLGS